MAGPDWSRAGDDKTFGNRFDDPKGKYRVLYASTERLACFVECLAAFRPDLALLSALSAIQGSDPKPVIDIEDWARKRMIGSALVKGRFADIYSADWVDFLRVALASTAVSMGIQEVDLSTLMAAKPRQLSQKASRVVRSKRLHGIFYCSRFGREF